MLILGFEKALICQRVPFGFMTSYRSTTAICPKTWQRYYIVYIGEGDSRKILFDLEDSR